MCVSTHIFLPYAFPRAVISQNLLAPPQTFGEFRSGLVSLKEFSTSQSSCLASSPTLSLFINPNMLKSQTSLWFNQTLLCRNEAKSLFFPTAQHFLEQEDQWCWQTIDQVLPISPLTRMWNWNCGQRPHPEVARSQEGRQSHFLYAFQFHSTRVVLEVGKEAWEMSFPRSFCNSLQPSSKVVAPFSLIPFPQELCVIFSLGHHIPLCIA